MIRDSVADNQTPWIFFCFQPFVHATSIVFPTTRCRLKMLKMERIKDYLLMEEEFVVNQERLKPQEEKTHEERSKVDDLRGTPMSVGTLEEIIDDDHAIISTSNGPEYYVSILSFVDKDLLEPGCSILLHHKVTAGILMVMATLLHTLICKVY